MTRVRVKHPFQVVHEGKAYWPDNAADIPEHVAAHWILNGWVVTDDTAKQASDSGGNAK
jgi:hypothetical protein